MYGSSEMLTNVQGAGEVQLQLLIKLFEISDKRDYRTAHDDYDVDDDHHY